MLVFGTEAGAQNVFGSVCHLSSHRVEQFLESRILCPVDFGNRSLLRRFCFVLGGRDDLLPGMVGVPAGFGDDLANFVLDLIEFLCMRRPVPGLQRISMA